MAERFGPHFAKSFRARKAEWLCSFILLGIALNILFVTDPWLWVLNGVIHTYTDNTTVGALYVLGFAVIRITALTINGWWRRTPYLRAGMSAISCFVWLQAAVLCFKFEVIYHFPVTGMGIFPCLLAFDIFNVFQASWDNEDEKLRARP